MAQLSDIDKIRKKRRRKVLFGRLLLLVLLTCVGVGLYAVKDKVSTIGFTDYVQDMLAGMGAGDGYPIDFAGDQVRGTYAMGENLAVLTDSNLVFYNKTGREIRSVQHKYSNPVVRVGGRRVLIYDRGGKKLRVESLSRTVSQKEFEYPIYAGDISVRGEVAVATGAQRRLAEMSVYDHLLTEPALYKFKSAENYITELDFSRDGKNVAVSAVNARGGDLVSSVHLFRLSQAEPVGMREFAGEIIHMVAPLRDGFCAVTDRRAVRLTGEGVIAQEYNYQYQTLASFDHNKAGYTALLFGDYRENKSGELILLGPDGIRVWGGEVSSHAELLCLGETRVSIAVDGELQSFDLAGAPVESLPLAVETISLQPVGASLYAITPQTIEKLEIG